MKCTSCGFVEARKDIHPVTPNPTCSHCDKPAQLDVTDLLLHRHGELVATSRVSQLRMAEAIEKALQAPADVPQTVLVEAPVGTGKSFAYSIPAVLSGQRTIISTAKKQLQHQLFEKDLPRLKEALKSNFRFALMKGKSNYACLQKITDYKPTAEQKKLGVDVELEKLYTQSLKDADLTTYTDDLPEMYYQLTAEDCLGRKCPQYEKCKYIEVRTRAKEAHVLIVNHHVAALDLRLGPGLLTGPYVNLIVDEAHQFEAALRAAYETKAHSGTLNRLQTLMDSVTSYGALFSDIVKDWDTMFRRLPTVEGAVAPRPFGDDGAAILLRLQDVLGAVRYELRLAGFEFSQEVERQVRVFRPRTDAMINHEGFQNIRDKHALKLDTDTIHKLHVLEGKLEKVTEFLTTVEDPGDNILICFERFGSQRLPALRATPINVSAFSGPKLATVGKKVFTSGTLAVGTQFGPFIRKLGLRQDVVLASPTDERGEYIPELDRDSAEAQQYATDTGDALFQNYYNYMREKRAASAPPPVTISPVITELVLPSPFDYKTQCLLYLPRSMPMPVTGMAPGRDTYIKALAKEIMLLIGASKGNAFVLFTARGDMEDVYKLVEPQCDQEIFLQEGESNATLRKYLATDNSVLFGVKTFWEGVDIPGEKLRLVVIAKLPFPPPGDPVHKKQEERFRAEMLEAGESESAIRSAIFQQLSIPDMLNDLRQGAGRLIRTTEDTGVLAILDSRMFTGSSKGDPMKGNIDRLPGYGGQAYKAINSPKITERMDVVTAQYRVWWKAQAAKKLT